MINSHGPACGVSQMDNQLTYEEFFGVKPEEKSKAKTLYQATSQVSGPTHQMKFKVDYSNIPEGHTKDTIMAGMGNAIKRISSLFKVIGTGTIPAFDTSFCANRFDFNIPSSYRRYDTDADYLIFVRLTSASGFLAGAAACRGNVEEKRPVVGVVLIGSAFFNMNSTAELQRFEDAMVHEVFHAIGFTPGLFDYFPVGQENLARNMTRTVNGRTRSYTAIIGNNTVQAAREHFNCASLDHVPLEDEGDTGSRGSHWEEKLFSEELMTPSIVSGPSPLSAITLAFFNDLGVYEVDVSKAQSFIAGRNAGCSFYNNNCSTEFPLYCTTRSRFSCRSDYLMKEICASNRFSNDCFVKQSFHKYSCLWSEDNEVQRTFPGEEYGLQSRCFEISISSGEGSSQTAGCYTSRCDNGQVIVSAPSSNGSGSIDFTCNPGASLTINNLTVFCPSDPAAFCATFTPKCPNNCSGNGLCLNDGTCFCNIFTRGDDCSIGNCCSSESVCSLSSLPQDRNNLVCSALKLVINVIVLIPLIW